MRFRTFLAISLLLVFAWSRAAEAMPLVWCMGSDGHNVIELANSGGCHGAAKADFYVDSGYATSLIGSPAGEHSDCKDIALPDKVQTSAKVFKTLAPPAPVATFVDSAEVYYTAWPIRPAVRVEPAAGHLAQLRTVVLRL